MRSNRIECTLFYCVEALVVELADTADSKSAIRENVRVQVPPRAPCMKWLLLKLKSLCLLFFVLLCFFYTNNNTFANITDNNLDNQDTDITTDGVDVKIKTEENKSFFSKYIYTDENPIFGNYKNMFSVFVGYSWYTQNTVLIAKGVENHGGEYVYVYERFFDFKRNIHHLEFFYSRVNKFLKLHGRFSVGLFAFVGKTTGCNIGNGEMQNIVKYKHVGVEMTQEFVWFGSSFLYSTIGVGVSYMIPSVDSSVRHLEPEKVNSLLNAVVLATVGHRFGDRVVVEFVFKHRSNGELSKDRNYGINELGMRLGVVF